MRKSIFFIVLVVLCTYIGVFTTSCSDKKKNTEPTPVDSIAADTTAQDSTDELISEAPLPKAADELFDDFVFNFCANKKLQYKRINFPLPFTKGNKTTLIQKNEWKMERFFMRQEFYTLILDNVKQLEWSKDTSIKHVVVEKIYLNNNHVKQYLFDRLNGEWKLTSIVQKPIDNHQNSSFLAFYKKFTTDSTFQVHSVSDPLTFIGPDPNDDFGSITGSLAPEQWVTFAPELPKGMIYNILYGQKYTQSSQKILMIRGIANGFQTELTFKKKAGKWMLVKLST